VIESIQNQSLTLPLPREKRKRRGVGAIHELPVHWTLEEILLIKIENKK
jgi:hypothetical protein